MEDNLIQYRLLDERNIELWRQLNVSCDIDVKFEDRTTYGLYSKGKKSTVYVPNSFLSAAGFTHELLHIYLRTKNVYILTGVLLMIREAPHMQNVLPESLICQAGGFLEHMKMLPIFKDMGFDESDFISDYFLDKLDDSKINELRNNMIKNPIFGRPYFNKYYVDLYIGTFFSARACPFTLLLAGDCKFNELRAICPDVYDVLDVFLTKWSDFDINNIDPIFNEYNTMENELYYGLEEWILNNRIK